MELTPKSWTNVVIIVVHIQDRYKLQGELFLLKYLYLFFRNIHYCFFTIFTPDSINLLRVIPMIFNIEF